MAHYRPWASRQHVPLLCVGGRDEFLDTRDEDRPVRRDELGHQLDQVRHRLVHHPPEPARVQVARGAGHRELEIHDTAEAVRETRCARVEPEVVRDADAVDAGEPAVRALGGLGFDEVIEAIGAALLHALEAEAHVYGELKAERFVCFEHVEPAQDGSLVVCRAAADEAAGLLVDDQREGLGVPSVALGCLEKIVNKGTTWDLG